jgi:DNA-binding transcriptional LysR family regulator
MLQAMRVYTRIVESGSFVRASEVVGLRSSTVAVALVRFAISTRSERSLAKIRIR